MCLNIHHFSEGYRESKTCKTLHRVKPHNEIRFTLQTIEDAEKSK